MIFSLILTNNLPILLLSHCKSDQPRESVGFFVPGKIENNQANPFQQPTGMRNALAGVTGVSLFCFKCQTARRSEMTDHTVLHNLQSIQDIDKIRAIEAVVDALAENKPLEMPINIDRETWDYVVELYTEVMQ